MKNLFIVTILVLLFADSRADIKYINVDQIDPAGNYRVQFAFLIKNLPYYDHWSPDWVYPVNKDSLIAGLKSCLSLFAPLKTNEYESSLLLGETAHYLYNLDQQAYYDTAEAYYLNAIRMNGKDCRGFWFLGYHYAQSNEIVKAATTFESARSLLTEGTPAEFWQEYAFTQLLSNKPSHARYAVDRFRAGGGISQLSKVMDSSLRAKVRPADPDSSYTNRNIWQSDGGDSLIGFISRPLGVRLEVDSGWNLQIEGYKNRMSAFIMTPGTLTGIKGNKIGYTIGLVIKAAKEGESLQDFMANMMKMGGTKDANFAFSDLYGNGLSYTYRDKTIYSTSGGAHIHFVGIERDCPAYPGMALEGLQQAQEIKGKAGAINFYTLAFSRSRFPGRIFYFFILDTCEDIHQESWIIFQGLVKKQMALD